LTWGGAWDRSPLVNDLSEPLVTGEHRRRRSNRKFRLVVLSLAIVGFVLGVALLTAGIVLSDLRWRTLGLLYTICAMGLYGIHKGFVYMSELKR
jgi:hypothetical protein